jgi:outer membrane protein assembly factor BamB
VDGSAIEAFEGSLAVQDDFPQQLLLAPDGDLIVASTDYFVARTVDVTRLSPDGAVRWMTSLPNHLIAAGMRFGPAGELVLVATAELGPDDHDVMRVTLNPDDGAVLGTLGIGVVDPLMGMSSQIGTGLVVDAQGRSFVSWYDETMDQLSVSAFDGEALSWQVTLAIPPGAFGEDFEAADDGSLLVLSADWTQSRGWVTALDPETGDELWQVSEVDLGLAGSYPTFHALAVSSAGVRVVGSQSYEFEGQWYTQAMVLGIGDGGIPLCANAITDLDPSTENPQVSLRFTEIIPDMDGGFFAIGHRYDASSPPLLIVDLLRARVR